MEKQSLRKSYGRWIFAHVFFWTIYTVLVAMVIPRVYHADGFALWPEHQKLLLALAPVVPVGLWLYATGRFNARSPDEFNADITLKATASAGAVVALILFAAGWINMIGGGGLIPDLRFMDIDLTPWAYLAAFFIVYVVQLARLRRKAIE